MASSAPLGFHRNTGMIALLVIGSILLLTSDASCRTSVLRNLLAHSLSKTAHELHLGRQGVHGNVRIALETALHQRRIPPEMHSLSLQAREVLIHFRPRPPGPARWLPGERDGGVTGAVWLQYKAR